MSVSSDLVKSPVTGFGSWQTKAYTCRVSCCCTQIPRGGKLKTGSKVKFFEMGINALGLTPRAASIWRSSAQNVSGAICCYDAGREETLERIKDCIGMLFVWGVCVYHETLFFVQRTDPCPHILFLGYTMIAERLSAISTPTIILACKSDPNTELRVTAAHGNSIGEPYNVGLIEGTTKTYEGKLKMRNAVRWPLYKLEERHRE